ncbi:Peptidyl-prolyl cis-trans isomerase CWC27 like protein [Eufriesea mexicana]|nr:Peptidyl-prolyl cis-trans isomerase CWC27 like protein [Eufriesea mexicana]
MLGFENECKVILGPTQLMMDNKQQPRVHVEGRVIVCKDRMNGIFVTVSSLNKEQKLGLRLSVWHTWPTERKKGANAVLRQSFKEFKEELTLNFMVPHGGLVFLRCWLVVYPLGRGAMTQVAGRVTKGKGRDEYFVPGLLVDSSKEFHTRLRFCRRDLIAMANAGKDDSSSLFFLTLSSTPDLQNKHTIFGKFTGETICNMLKFEEALVDEESEEVKDSSKTKAAAVRDFNLLLFGEEAEENEEESKLNKKFRDKCKLAHDHLTDPKLSSQPAVETPGLVNKKKEGKP